MKSLRALKAAGLILAAVVLGLMTVQGSYALWNATATSNAGTIQAADFKVKVRIGDVTTLVSPGQAFALPDVTLSLATTDSAIAVTPVRVTTDSNVADTSPFRTTTTVSVNPVPDGSPLVVAVAEGATNGVCPADPTEYKNSVVIPSQKAKVEQILCFRTALKVGTTNHMLGGPGIATSATLNVAQVAPAPTN